MIKDRVITDFAFQGAIILDGVFHYFGPDIFLDITEFLISGFIDVIDAVQRPTKTNCKIRISEIHYTAYISSINEYFPLLLGLRHEFLKAFNSQEMFTSSCVHYYETTNK